MFDSIEKDAALMSYLADTLDVIREKLQHGHVSEAIKTTDDLKRFVKGRHFAFQGELARLRTPDA